MKATKTVDRPGQDLVDYRRNSELIGALECPLCHRQEAPFSDHHLIPKTRGGANKETVTICIDCHNALHAQFSNKELEKIYNNVEMLMTNETFSRTVKFISKQNPSKRIKTKLSTTQKHRGRNG